LGCFAFSFLKAHSPFQVKASTGVLWYHPVQPRLLPTPGIKETDATSLSFPVVGQFHFIKNVFQWGSRLMDFFNTPPLVSSFCEHFFWLGVCVLAHILSWVHPFFWPPCPSIECGSKRSLFYLVFFSILLVLVFYWHGSLSRG